MSFDIRRCSKEELDALNARAQAWKEQRLFEAKPADDAVAPLEELPGEAQLTLNFDD